MAELDYDALQRLADAATEGPWQWTREPGDEEGSLEAPSEEGYVLGVYGMHTEGFIDVGKADAEFIAASRSAIPALLDRVRELERAEEEAARLGGVEGLLMGASDWRDIYKAERDAALSTIAKVEALHHKITRYGNDMYSISAESYEDDPSGYEDLEPFDLCAECYAVEELICEECGGDAPVGHRSNWPCPTARALGSVPSTGEGNDG